MFDALLEQLKKQSVSFLFFVVGVAIGIVITLAIYAVFASRKREVRRGGAPLALPFLDESVYRVKYSGTGFKFDEKTEAFFAELKYCIDETVRLYFGDGVKTVSVPFLDKMFDGGLNLPISFTVYELTGFIDCLLDGLEKVYDGFIDSEEFNFLWSFRFFVAKGLNKNPHDLPIAKIIEIVSDKLEKAKKEKDENQKVGFFASLGKRVTRAAMDRIVEPNLSPKIDEVFAEALKIAVENLGVLFSHNLAGGGAQSMAYLVSDEEDIA